MPPKRCILAPTMIIHVTKTTDCWSEHWLSHYTGTSQWMGYIRHQSVLEVIEKIAGKSVKCKYQSDSDKGQTVIARWLGKTISKSTGLRRYSWYAMVSSYQKWWYEWTMVNQWQGHGHSMFTDVQAKAWPPPEEQAQNAEEVYACSYRKVLCSYTQFIAACCVWGCVVMLNPVHRWKCLQWEYEQQNGKKKKKMKKKDMWSDSCGCYYVT